MTDSFSKEVDDDVQERETTTLKSMSSCGASSLSRFMATLNCPVNHVSMAHYVVAATASL